MTGVAAGGSLVSASLPIGRASSSLDLGHCDLLGTLVLVLGPVFRYGAFFFV